jgi:Radical SAM superfamily
MNTVPVLQPNDVGLILSYQCNSNCAHCIYNCGTEWKDWASEETVREALKAMQVWQPNLQVHITGGEPFLRFPLLLFAVQTAHELGIAVYLETNAGWAVCEELVDRHLRQLRQAGLAAVLISCSPFHAESIPPERTMRLISKAIKIFGMERVIVYQSQWLEQMRQFGDDHSNPLERYVEEYGQEAAGRMFWQGYGLMGGGRSGYRLGHLVQGKMPEAFRIESCRWEILHAPHSHLDLYGNFIPGFCGGLSLGDWHDLPGLIRAYQAGEVSPFLARLIEGGSYGLYAWARDEFGYQPLPQGYVDKCHLCVDVRHHLYAYGGFSELQPEGFYSSPI